MRQYYSRDKKRREDAKKKRREEKRLKRLNKTPTIDSSQKTTDAGPAAGEAGVEIPGREAKQ